MPVWSPKTQTSHTATANMGNGNASTCLNVSIHRPGFGSRSAMAGQNERTTYGVAIPTPSPPKIASASGIGRTMAAPMAAPMNGAVHGVATMVASTPVMNDQPSPSPCPMPPSRVSDAPSSTTPASHSPSPNMRAASSATMVGLWSW